MPDWLRVLAPALAAAPALGDCALALLRAGSRVALLSRFFATQKVAVTDGAAFHFD